jgi:hypothetical protein
MGRLCLRRQRLLQRFSLRLHFFSSAAAPCGNAVPRTVASAKPPSPRSTPRRAVPPARPRATRSSVAASMAAPPSVAQGDRHAPQGLKVDDVLTPFILDRSQPRAPRSMYGDGYGGFGAFAHGHAAADVPKPDAGQEPTRERAGFTRDGAGEPSRKDLARVKSQA